MNNIIPVYKNEVETWIERLSAAERHYEKYHRLVAETRNYYNLDRLWADGKTVDLKDLLEEIE